MRSLPFLLVLISSVVITSGCAGRPELTPNAYGTILQELPALKAAEEPFPFPVQDGDDHKNCVFNELDFM